MKALAAALVVLSALSQAPQSPRVRWQWMKGPLYGPARSVISHQGRLLITTPFVAWMSADAGRRWDVPPQPLAAARQLAVTERDLFRDALTGIERSSDAGATWTPCGAVPVDRRLGHDVASLAADGQRVYVSVQRLGIFASADRCRTWKKLALPVASDAAGIIAFARGERVIVGGNAGSFLSTDAGTTWTSIEAAVPDALIFEPYCDGFLLAGTSRGLRLSKDGGRSWTAAGLDERWTPALTSPVCGTIYAAVKDEGRWTYSVMRSVDDGKTWAAFNAGLTPHPIYALSSTGSQSIFAAGAAGVFRSTGAEGWAPFGPPHKPVVGIVAAPWNAVVAAADDALYAMAGASPWRMLLFGHDAHVSEDRPMASASTIVITSNGDLLVGGRYGALRSADRGNTWRRAELPQSVAAFATTPPGTILAGTRIGIFRSTDGGGTWIHRPLVTPQPEVLAIATAGDGSLYAGTRGGEILHSTSDGDRWVPMGALPGAVQALLVTRAGTVVAGNDFGCFQWRPQEGTWLPLSAQKPGALRMVRALVQHPDGAIFAATDGLGIFVSRDQGGTWLPANDGLSVARVLSLAVGPDGRLYAGTTEGAFQGSM